MSVQHLPLNGLRRINVEHNSTQFQNPEIHLIKCLPEDCGFRVESQGLLTWVRPPGHMVLVPLVCIRVKAHEDYGPR
jgi:hypothetical protein